MTMGDVTLDDQYDEIYNQREAKLYGELRKDVYGEDFGQFCWSPVSEQDRFTSWLQLSPESKFLDVGCGSGGPTVRIVKSTACQASGIDVSEEAIHVANALAQREGLSDRMDFQLVDAAQGLAFVDGRFNGIICFDTLQHFPDRNVLFAEWARLLKPGGRLVFQDAVVITGPLSSYELTVRASLGFYLFAPAGTDEAALEKAGLEIQKHEDVTASMTEIASRWLASRAARAEELIQVESNERFNKLQEFFNVTHNMTAKGRLSRHAFLAQKPK